MKLYEMYRIHRSTLANQYPPIKCDHFALLFIRNGILMWLYWDGFSLHFHSVIPFNLSACISFSFSHWFDCNGWRYRAGAGSRTWRIMPITTKPNENNKRKKKPTKINKNNNHNRALAWHYLPQSVQVKQTQKPAQPIKINISIDK